MEFQLRHAIFDGDLPTVQRILQEPAGGGVNVNAGINEDGWTALHFSVARGHLRIVQAILQVGGVNVNVRTVTGLTPLHMAHWLTEGDRLPIIQALLDAGANPAVPNRDLDTPLHSACFWRRLDVAQLLIQRQGSECLALKNNVEQTPLDRLSIGQDHNNIPGGVANSIRQLILQVYAGMIAQRDGLLCLHAVLQDSTFIHGNEEDGNEKKSRLEAGTLNMESLQSLLEYLIAAEPGSVRALDRDGWLPLQVACQRNFPDLVLNVLLRSYPDALL